MEGDKPKAEKKNSSSDSDSDCCDHDNKKTTTVVVPEKEEKQDIKSSVLGSEECPVPSDETEIYFQEVFRIKKIEGLEACSQLQIISLRKNLLTKIEGLEACT